MESLERTRRRFAEGIRRLSALRSQRLVDALAAVRREDFLGPGPWQVLRVSEFGRGYQRTPDGDPRHLCDDVLVALDPERNLNNGEPSTLLRWLDDLDLPPGGRFLHIGCGVGYYTAIAAEALAGGAAVGVEVDPGLAERARRNLAPWPGVQVVAGDGSGFFGEPFDAILVNAGATEPLSRWVDQLRPGGRLLVPLTVDLPMAGIGAGQMLLVVREGGGHSARFTGPLGIFHCAGARTADGMRLLKQAYERGGHESVHSLRREPHPPGPGCWLHTGRFCLSQLPVRRGSAGEREEGAGMA